jgi:hypothetical protein
LSATIGMKLAETSVFKSEQGTGNDTKQYESFTGYR